MEFLHSTFAKKNVGPSNARQYVHCIFKNVALGDVNTWNQLYGCVIVEESHKISFHILSRSP
jgi:hypothetical protein